MQQQCRLPMSCSGGRSYGRKAYDSLVRARSPVANPIDHVRVPAAITSTFADYAWLDGADVDHESVALAMLDGSRFPVLLERDRTSGPPSLRVAERGTGLTLAWEERDQANGSHHVLLASNMLQNSPGLGPHALLFFMWLILPLAGLLCRLLACWP